MMPLTRRNTPSTPVGWSAVVRPYLQLAVAAFGFLAVALVFTTRLRNLHVNSAEEFYQKLEREAQVRRVAEASANVHATAENALRSGDLETELVRLDSAESQFRADVAAMRAMFARQLPPAEYAVAMPHLDALESSGLGVVHRGRQIIQALVSGRPELAAALTPELTRHLKESIRRERELHAMEGEMLRKRLQLERLAADRLRLAQIGLSAVALLVLTGIVHRTRRIARMAAAEERARSDQLEELARREAGLQELRRTLESRVEERTAQLAEQHAFLRSVIDTIPGPVFAKDGEGRYMLANEAVAEIYGITAEELLGKTDADFHLDPDQVAQSAEADGRVLETGVHLFIPAAPITDAKGTVRWLQTIKVPLARTAGQPDQVLGVSTDVTALRRASEAERDARQAAEAANRAKSDFVAGMSHEIRTPMNGVIGMLELALETGLAPEQQDLVETAFASAEALLLIINDVLDFSRIEAGHMDLDPAPFHVGRLVAGTAAPLKLAAHRKGLAYRADVAPEASRTVLGDAGRIRQVLVNLIGNAIKFTERGELCVRVEAGPADGSEVELRFIVCDTGIGIAAAHQDSIFEAFHQADASINRRFGGTGLGLSISARLVHLLGGSLGVQSTPGEGSTFTFTLRLPLAADEASPVPADGAANGGSVTWTGRSLHVLVAEDNPVNRKLARMLLERAGHSVASAIDGEAAVAAVMRDAYDVVLMDVHMPRQSGLDAARQIRTAEAASGKRRTPIIAATASAMASDRDACMEAGMDGYVTKPLRPRALFAAIAAVTATSDGANADGGAAPLPASAPAAGPAAAAALVPATAAASSADVATADPAGDEARLLRTVGGDRLLLGELVELFLEDAPVQVARIRAAVQSGDAAGVRAAAHSVKGAAASLTGSAAASAAGSLERMATAGTVEAAGPEVKRLEEALADLRSWLLSLLNGSTA